MNQTRQIYRFTAMTAIFFFVFTAVGLAQMQGLPRVSQHAVASQSVGITNITIDYHRPGVKDRKVWGALVPFDNVWRAGANDNTTISFSHAVTIGDQSVPAGTYGLHMIPTAGDWTVILSNNSTSWGSFTYDGKEDVVRATVTPRSGPHVEWLEYGFSNPGPTSLTAELRWEKKIVPFVIEVPTHDHVVTYLREQMRHLPRFTAWGPRDAANYCLQNDVNLDEAMTWIDRSITSEKNFSNMQVKAGLLEKAGKSDEASAIMEESSKTATQRQINALGYQYLGKKNYEKAIAMFEKNVKDYPESWNAHDSLAELHAATGKTKKAISGYEKALEMAPDAQKSRINGVLDGLRE